MEKYNSFTKIEHAKLKVEKLKRFYTHLGVFIVINFVITSIKVSGDLGSWEEFTSSLFSLNVLFSWTVWGFLLLIHAFSVFVFPKILGYDWESKKIEELMEDELNSKK